MTALSFAGQPPFLVGRERELSVLRDHLSATLNGSGSVVLIGGEAGIGKTALADALCREAREQGALVLIGRSFDLTESPPFGPWIDLFAHYRPTDDLPPPPAPFAERGTVGAVASQASLFHAVLDFLATLAAQRPLVVLLEDAHWQDPASLDLLRFLAREVADLPILLLVTHRTEELTPRHPLHSLLPLLVREAHAGRLDVRPLDALAVRTLVDRRYRLAAGDASRLVDYLQARAEGHALYIAEVLRSLEEAGVLNREASGRLGDLTGIGVPALLKQVIEGRVSRLDEEVQQLLAVAAVIGQEVPLAVWAAVAAVDEEAVAVAIEQATAAHVMEETAEGTRFAHALVREALYAGVSGVRRRALHRRTGEILAERRQPDPDAVAYHFQRADDARAVGWLLRAAERARASYAWTTAAERYEAALARMGDDDDRVRERAWLLFGLAAVRRYNDPQQSATLLEEAALLARRCGDRLLAARARLYHGLVLCFLNDLVPGLADLRAGADALDALPVTERATGLAYDRADATVNRGTVILWLANAGRLVEAEQMGERYMAEIPLADAKGAAAAPFADAYFGLAIAHAFRGRAEMARHAYEHAHAIYRAIGHYHIAGAALVSLLANVAIPYAADRVAERERLAGEAEATWTQVGEVLQDLVPRTAWLPVMAVDGRWDAVGELGVASRHSMIPVIEGYYGRVALARGDGAPIQWLIDAWMPAGPGTAPEQVRFQGAAFTQPLAAAWALAVGDIDGAREWLEAHDRWLEWSGAILGRSEGQALWAHYHRQRGDRVKARAHAERALVLATDPRQPLTLLAAHRLLGEFDTEAGWYDDAADHLDASLALAAACHAPYERALTLLALAELGWARGEVDEAKRILDEVHAICEPLGAKPALARADALAARLAATPTAVPTHPGGLSVREVEVLRLVAQGLTNPQVAERLYLSPRTVEQHLRSIYSKCSVSTRAAATAFAFQHGLAGQ